MSATANLPNKGNESAYKYKAILNAVNEGVLILDVHGNVLEANDLFYLIHGIDKDHPGNVSVIASQQIYQLFDLNDNLIPFDQWPYWKAIHGETVNNVEYKASNKVSGKEYYGMFSAIPIYENNIITFIVLTIKIISDQVILRKKLEYNEKLLKLIIDNSQDGIHLLDLEKQKYEFMSPAQEELTGFPLEDLMFEMDKAVERLHPDDVESVNAYLEKVINDQNPGKPVEYRWKVKNGEYRWFSDNRKAVKDEDGKVIKLVGVSRDITEQKKLEQELKRKNQQLQESYELQQNLLYMAAHDLKSPISNIRMVLYLLENNEEDRLLQYFPKLKELSERLQNVIGGLTQILQAQSENNELESVQVSLKEVLENVKKENQQKLKECNGFINEQFESNLSLKYVYPFIFSILNNLVSNAIKYRSDKRQLEINISAEKINNQILLKVSDNGIGMDLTRFGKYLFHPFKRLSGNTDGTGIGLYIINNLVKRNGGRIEVESEVDKGSVISCYLNEY